MLSTALKLAEEFTPEQKALLESSVHAVTKDCHVDGGNDMAFAELLNLYRQLCGFMSSNIHSMNLSIIDNVCDYLNEHYTDPNLCLDIVAEHFTVSYYFLSHIFKSETNKSFSDRLNDTRIYHAMELLKATGLPVQTIAKQVGYTNWSTFLRAFRKRADLTPVQYRHAHS